MKKTRTKYLRLAAVALIAAVALLDAAFLILPDAAMSPAENRALQQMPALTLVMRRPGVSVNTPVSPYCSVCRATWFSIGAPLSERSVQT